ncbi:MAG: ArdC family protein [Planctomycetota bacterium]
MASGKRYRRINVFPLAMASMNRGFSSDYWLTFKQTKELGGTVRKGEKSSLVTFFKMLETKDRTTGQEFRYHTSGCI